MDRQVKASIAKALRSAAIALHGSLVPAYTLDIDPFKDSLKKLKDWRKSFLKTQQAEDENRLAAYKKSLTDLSFEIATNLSLIEVELVEEQGKLSDDKSNSPDKKRRKALVSKYKEAIGKSEVLIKAIKGIIR